MKNKILESNRLAFYHMEYKDFDELASMLQDERVMYAWEYTFSDDEVYDWIHRALKRYEADGTAHFLAVRKDNGEIVGQIGLVMQDLNNEKLLELGYMLKAKHMKKGYANEGGEAFLNYAFHHLHVTKVIGEIKVNNVSSMNTALKLGLKPVSSIIKHVNGKDMEHVVLEIHREEYIKKA